MGVTDSIVIEIPRLPDPQVRGNARGHWKGIHPIARAEREAGHGYALEAIGASESNDFPWDRVSVHYDFYNAAWVDYANLARGIKHWEDGFTDAGLWVDDSPRYIKEWSLSFIKVKHRKDARTVITVRRV